MAFETTSELRSLLQEEVNDTSPSATTLVRYLGLLDRAHKVICGGGGELNTDDTGRAIRQPFIFPWAVSATPLVQNTVAPITSLTGSVTQGATSLTMSATYATSLVGYYLRFTGDGEVYRITAHTAGTDTVTLDAGYIEASQTAGEMEIFKLDYTFGDGSTDNLMFPIGQIRLSSKGSVATRLSMVDLNELKDRFPWGRIESGKPTLAAVVSQGQGTVTVRLSHYPDEATRLELDWVPVPSALDTTSSDPLIPKHHRIVLVHLAAFYHLRRRNDERAKDHLTTAKQLYEAMVTEARQIYGGNDEMFGAIAPFPNGFSTYNQRLGRIGVVSDI